MSCYRVATPNCFGKLKFYRLYIIGDHVRDIALGKYCRKEVKETGDRNTIFSPRKENTKKRKEINKHGQGILLTIPWGSLPCFTVMIVIFICSLIS